MNMSVDSDSRFAEGVKRSTFRALLKVQEDMPEPSGVDREIARFLYEEYHEQTRNWKRQLYYRFKPLMPRRLQLMLRKRYTTVQAAQAFPAWPVEPILVEKAGLYLRALAEAHSTVYHLAFWPDGHRFCFLITHDVEWDAGLRRAPAIVALEKSLGFTSSWNLVPERYPIDWAVVDRLRTAGCEIGIHGLKHDGRLFESSSLFANRLEKIHAHARAWNAQGFRSPSTLRNPRWMSRMEFEYDSSFPDTDPYEPQPGGCCSIWPYFLGAMVELPMTLPQDHTLFEILGQKDIGTWRRKVEWIAEHGGVAVVNVHPDYMLTDDRLRLYEDLLRFMKDVQGMWHVLPREAAQWWKERDLSSVRVNGADVRVKGPAAIRGTILRSALENGVLSSTRLV